MKKYVYSVSEYLKEIEDICETFRFHDSSYALRNRAMIVFRGENKAHEYPCLSSFGRLRKTDNSIKLRHESHGLRAWYEESVLSSVVGNVDNLWVRLTWARHYGLYTRLTDWTTNPLVALWFAVWNEQYQDDGVVYIVKNLPVDFDFINSSTPFLEHESNESYQISDPEGGMTGEATSLFFYPHLSFHSRIFKQSGVFHVCTDINKSALDYENTKNEIVVPSELKEKIFSELNACGINAANLGLSDPEVIGKRINAEIKGKNVSGRYGIY